MMAAVMGTFLVIILIIVMVLLISCVRIVRQAQALVIERLGAYQATWGTGLHFKLPIVDRVARRVDMKRAGCRFLRHSRLSQKDNVTMRNRYRCILPDYRSEDVLLWSGKIRSWRSRT